MIIGIAEEIDDAVCGLIPANTPLDLRQAARAVNMRLKRATQLQTDPSFRQAFHEATEAFRKCQEPKNIAVAASIRDDPRSSPKDKVRAIECLRGPRPVAAAIFNNHLTQNIGGQPVRAGYVIDLRDPEPAPKTIEGRIVDITPRENNAGNAVGDVEKERAEAARRA